MGGKRHVSGDSVVLVHGLWMHGLVMLPLHWLLSRRGFVVRRFSYRSLRHGLRQNAAALARFADALPGERVHVVGHSLGGLVALTALPLRRDGRQRRTVLMGAPVGGSHCASFLLRQPLLRAVVGRSLGDWLAQAPSATPSGADIGVLAGRASWGLGRLIPGLPVPNDGVVSVAETVLPAARDTVCLPVSHTQMLFSPACARQIGAFLRTGSFIHD